MLGTMTDIHPFEHGRHTLFPFRSTHVQILQGQFHILEDIQFINQIEALEYKADIAFAELGTVAFLQLSHFLSHQFITATRRIIQQTQDIQQS